MAAGRASADCVRLCRVCALRLQASIDFRRPLVSAAQDVPRTFPNNSWVQSEAGQNALRHVLYAFAHHNPRVG